jgi:hypothetical protein
MISATRQNTVIISVLENNNLAPLRQLTFAERGELIACACRIAEAIETSRIQMGSAPSQPAPWPASTWTFLAECARRAREV